MGKTDMNRRPLLTLLPKPFFSAPVYTLIMYSFLSWICTECFGLLDALPGSVSSSGIKMRCDEDHIWTQNLI